ncbi:hypothetical protein ABK040_005263 [Willaertia magna]
MSGSGEGFGCGGASISMGGEEEINSTQEDGAFEEFVKATIYDMNIDPIVTPDSTSHPNHTLYSSYGEELLENFSNSRAKGGDKSFPQIIDNTGTYLNGVYGDTDLQVQFNPDVFDYNQWTLLMRVFVESGSTTVFAMGHGWRWFGISLTEVYLNNMDQRYPYSGLKKNEWNNIYVSFNMNDRVIHVIVNGKENKIVVPSDVNLNVLQEDEYVTSTEKCLTHVNYSNANTLKGYVSSEVLLTKSCQSFDELTQLASLLLKSHLKPTSIGDSSEAKSYGKVHHINSTEEFNNFVKNNELVVVDFSATWCCPCQMIAPVYEHLPREFEGIKFLKVDIDEQSALSDEHNVSAVPTFLFFKNGECIEDYRFAWCFGKCNTKEKVIDISATYNTSFILTENGKVYSCGDNTYAADAQPKGFQKLRNEFQLVQNDKLVKEFIAGYFFAAFKTVDDKYQMECGGYGSVVVTKNCKIYYTGEFSCRAMFGRSVTNFTQTAHSNILSTRFKKL